jgi:hypothetical protein
VTDGLLNVATEQANWVTSHRQVDLLTRGRFTLSPISRPIDSAQPPFLAFQGDWMPDRMSQGTVTKFMLEDWSSVLPTGVPWSRRSSVFTVDE